MVSHKRDYCMLYTILTVIVHFTVLYLAKMQNIECFNYITMELFESRKVRFKMWLPW